MPREMFITEDTGPYYHREMLTEDIGSHYA